MLAKQTTHLKQIVKTALPFVLFVLVALLLTHDFDFVRDDHQFFEQAEPALTWNALKTDLTQNYFGTSAQLQSRPLYYRPLTSLAYRLENALFAGWAPGYQAVSIIAFSMFLILLFCLLLSYGLEREWAWLVVGVLMTHNISHPLWAYKTGLIDTLALIFMTLSLLSLRHITLKTVVWCTLFWLVALGCKENALWVLPLLSWQLWRARRKWMLPTLGAWGLLLVAYLGWRSTIVMMPQTFEDPSIWPPALAAWLRESLLTPLFIFLQPASLSAQEFVPVSHPRQTMLVITALLVWGGLLIGAWRQKRQSAVMLLLGFWLFWTLSLLNLRYLPEGRSFYLYLPPHLLLVPTICLTLAVIAVLKPYRRACRLLWLLLPWCALMSMPLLGSWQSTQQRFTFLTQNQTPEVGPYLVLADMLQQQNRSDKALDVLDSAPHVFYSSRFHRLRALLAHRLLRDDAVASIGLARQLARQETQMELPHLLNEGRVEVAIRYLEIKARHYPHDHWYAQALEALRSGKALPPFPNH